MKNGSWSWVKLSDASFPKLAGNARFLDDQVTAVLPVALEPGKTYAIWINKPPNEISRTRTDTRPCRICWSFR